MTSSATGLTQPLAMINGYALDVTVSEEYTFDSDVTDFPVESGSSVVDNIRPKPIVVRIEGIISNTPIGNIVQARKAAGIGGNQANRPSDEAYDVLLKIRDKREPVTISTSLRAYENMAMQSLSIPRATGRGDELRFSATFKQVEIVTNKRTKRVATPAGVGKHTVDGAPKATALTVINAYQIPSWLANAVPGERFSVNKYIWFDKQLGGWRFNLIHLGGGWTAFRDRPWGVSFADYEGPNHKTDEQYRQDIKAAYKAHPYNVLASTASNPLNPYNPFFSVSNLDPLNPFGVTLGNISDVVTVKAVIKDKVG